MKKKALYNPYFLYAHPGKKLLFMGSEFGQWREWNHDASLDWHLLQYPAHQGVQRWVRDLNHLYRSEAALHARDFITDGFRWVDVHNREQSVIAFIRSGERPADSILGVCNFTPVPG